MMVLILNAIYMHTLLFSIFIADQYKKNGGQKYILFIPIMRFNSNAYYNHTPMSQTRPHILWQSYM